MRNIIFTSFWFMCSDVNGCRSFRMFDSYYFSIDMRNFCEIFWCACFKELFDTCETCRDISSFFRDSSCMECTHRQLRSWFTDGLCRDDTNRCTDFDETISSEIHTITVLANAFMGFTHKHRSYWHDVNF